MKLSLMLIPALLLAAAPEAAVRFEADGIRVGSELVTGASLSLKSSGALPLLVSGSAVESLSGEGLALSLDGRQILLGAGLRIARAANGYVLSTHDAAFTVGTAKASLAATRTAAFTITETGFDFGALGALPGTALTATVTAPAAAMPALQSGPQISPEKKGATSLKPQQRQVHSNGSPFVQSEAASSIAIRQLTLVRLLQLSQDGSP